jgi:hypothetical protein
MTTSGFFTKGTQPVAHLALGLPTNNLLCWGVSCARKRKESIMPEEKNSMQKTWKLVTRSIVCLAVIGLLASQVAAQGPIVLDGVGDDWDPAWQIATDGLDVFLTDTGAHPHDPPTYARSGYDAIGLWAHYQASDDRWYFRIDIDGRGGDSDSRVGTASDLGVGTNGFDEGPLVVPPFEDGQGLGNSEAYKLGFQFESDGVGPTTELGPGTSILPGVVSAMTSGLAGQGVYSTTVPGVIEVALDRSTLFPEDDPHSQLWVSAQVGDNNDRVSDDQVAATLVTALDLLVECPAAPIVSGDEATFPLNYAIPADAAQGATDVVLTAVVPAGTTFVSASDGGTEAGGVITWQLGDLAPGDGGQVTFTLRIDEPLTSITIESEIRSAEGLRFRAANACSILQPTATSTMTPTPSSTPTNTPTPTPTNTPVDTTTPRPTSTPPVPSGPPPVVPEPATATLLLTGLAGLGGYVALQWRARRRK